MTMERERDMLDDVTEAQAATDPKAREEWEAMKVVTLLIKARKDQRLTQADVAARMSVSQQRVAEIERRPWGVAFGRIAAYARAIGVEVGIVGELPKAA